MIALLTQPHHAMIEKNLRQPLLSKRIPFCHEITLRIPHLPGLVTGFTRDISMTGMFVRSRDLAIPGTTVTFVVDSGEVPIRGQAEVAWMREKDEGAKRPRGMGLRFVRLSQGSRRRIRRAVAERILRDGTRSDRDELRSMSEKSLHEALAEQIQTGPATGTYTGPASMAYGVDPKKLHPYAGAAAARRLPIWRRYGGVAFATLLLAGGVIAGLLFLL